MRERRQRRLSPIVDYFIGRPVVGLEKTGNPRNCWALRLEGDVLIHNKDEDREIPDDLDVAGTSLLRVAYHEDMTRLIVGTVNPQTEMIERSCEIIFTPSNYTIADPEYSGDDEVYPQHVDAEEDEILAARPEDPSPERVADGPTPPEDE